MKVNIKTLKGEIFVIEVEPTDTIATVKQKISELKGFAPDAQKIILKGKSTNNEDQLDKLPLSETDFLVVMTQVVKPAPKKLEEPAKDMQFNQGKLKEPQKSSQVKKEMPNQNGQSNDLTFQEGQIISLMSMGFSRQMCIQSLQAAYGNNERAVQYLLNGIPSTLGRTEGVSSVFKDVIDQPQFRQWVQLIRQNPGSLQASMAQISNTSPEIFNLIVAYPEEFEQLILGAADEGALEAEAEDGSFDEQQQGAILVTETEEQAIHRLTLLGFSKIEAAQAYLACDKNEEVAANLLFERLATGDIEQGPPEDEVEDEEGDDDNLFN